MTHRVDGRTGTKGGLPLPSDELGWEERQAEFDRMAEELGACSTNAQRRVWWFARDSGVTVEQFTHDNWWVRAGFSKRCLELFWMLCQNDSPAADTEAGFINACRNEELTRYRNVGDVTIKQALAVLGYERRRSRCKLCGAYTVAHDHGYTGNDHRGTKRGKQDLFEVTKLKGKQ